MGSRPREAASLLKEAFRLQIVASAEKLQLVEIYQRPIVAGRILTGSRYVLTGDERGAIRVRASVGASQTALADLEIRIRQSHHRCVHSRQCHHVGGGIFGDAGLCEHRQGPDLRGEREDAAGVSHHPHRERSDTARLLSHSRS